MEIASIVNQYYTAYLNKHGQKALQVISKHYMLFGVVGRLIQESFLLNVLSVTTRNGDLYHVAIDIVQNVRIMLRVNG